MNCIELWPSLQHCIESAARKEFWNLAGRYPEVESTDGIVEERIELLRVFLQSADFASLRSQSESHLIEGRKVKFVICRKDGELDYRMEIVGDV
jgi:hypothetical protein